MKRWQSDVDIAITKKIKLSDEGESESDESLINTLPEEILLLIFSFMLPTQICDNISQVCKRWHDLHQNPCIFRVFNFIGPQDVDTVVGFLKHAPWLKSLTLVNQTETAAILEEVSTFNRRLEILTLIGCRGSISMKNIQASTMKRVIRKCPLLKELRIKNSHALSKAFFRQVGPRLPLLRKVHYVEVKNFGSEAMRSLVENCPHLEELRACHKFQGLVDSGTNDADVQVLCDKLRGSLKRLELSAVEWTEKGFEKLAECGNLESLTLRYALRLSSQGLLKLAALTNLRQLDISMALFVNEDTWTYLFRWGHLENLIGLSLVICNITNDAAIALGDNLSKLEKLRLTGCMGLGKAGVDHVITHCSRLLQVELLFMDPSICTSLLLIPAFLPMLQTISVISYSVLVRETLQEVGRQMPTLTVQHGDPRWLDFFLGLLHIVDVTIDVDDD